MDRDYLKRLHQQLRPTNLQTRTGSWYSIQNLGETSTEVCLFDEIGFFGVSAARFIDDLRAISTSTITLRISSPGGDVADGLAILNALRQHPAEIHTVVEGLAASAASFIAMAGDSVLMSPNSMLMVHDAMTVCAGNAADMQTTADLLEKHSANIADIYAQRSGRPHEEMRALMLAETWMTDQEAVDAGLADGIVGREHPAEEREEGNRPGARTRTLLNTVVPRHKTDTVDTDWDSNDAETALKKPITVARARRMYAWYDAEQLDEGELPRQALKFPHHEVDEDGEAGAANLAAVRNALSRLSSADIPEGDREGVRAHLQAHLDDAPEDESSEGNDDNVADNVKEDISPLAAWDLKAIREALTAAKEATPHG